MIKEYEFNAEYPGGEIGVAKYECDGVIIDSGKYIILKHNCALCSKRVMLFDSRYDSHYNVITQFVIGKHTVHICKRCMEIIEKLSADHIEILFGVLNGEHPVVRSNSLEANLLGKFKLPKQRPSVRNVIPLNTPTGDKRKDNHNGNS